MKKVLCILIALTFLSGGTAWAKHKKSESKTSSKSQSSSKSKKKKSKKASKGKKGSKSKDGSNDNGSISHSDVTINLKDDK